LFVQGQPVDIGCFRLFQSARHRQQNGHVVVASGQFHAEIGA
jgi:hypothetical protein